MKKFLVSMVIGSIVLTGCQLLPRATTEETQITETRQTTVETMVTTPDPTEIITFTEPVELNVLEIMNRKKTFYKERLEGDEEIEESDENVQNYINNLTYSTRLWKTGTFSAGTYIGQNLVVGQIGCDGPCPAYTVRFAVDETNDTWTLLTNYSYAVTSIEEIIFPIDAQETALVIDAFETPESLEMYDTTKVVLADRAATTTMDLEGLTLETVDFTTPAFQKLFLFGDCLYGVMPDGVVARYVFVPEEFIKESGAGKGDMNIFFTEKEFTFTDTKGETTTQTYSVEKGGCGIAGTGCFPNMEALDGEENMLVKVGTLGTMDAFMFESIEGDETLEGSLKTAVKRRYDSYLMKREYDEEFKNEPELSKEEMLQSNDLLLIKLDNGNYTLVATKAYTPATECGKPVIYLYPTETTTISVTVGIDEMTKSIPTYGTNGWTVRASSDGTLVNSTDGQTYPYLFWEGLSQKALTTGPGWTIAKKDVETVLPKVLQNMGLNKQETADFMEFWGPRIATEKSPYIEFNFVPQKTFDQIAPLTVTPTPDTILRIFMIYRGVQKQGLPVPHYSPVQRNGFTLIEWGGALQ